MPLRLLIPAVLLAIGLIMTAVGAIAEIKSRHEDMEFDVANRAASLGNREVATIEYSFARDDVDSVRQQVALLVSEPGLDFAVLSDESGQVVQATKGEFRGQAVAGALGAPALALLEAARAGDRAQYRMTSGGDYFEAVFPVHLHLKPGELRSRRVGALYLAFDLSDAHAMARAHAIREAAGLALGMLVLGVLASLYLRHVISRRVALLLRAANRFASGDLQARADVGGRDELSDLADGFNGMADTIQNRELSLQRLNEDLRQSEARFRQVVEKITEAFWIVDTASGALIYTSPVFERIWGLGRAQLDASPRAWLDAIHPEDRPRMERAIQTSPEQGGYDEIFRVCRPDGSQRWVRDRCFPVRDDAGAVNRVVGVTEDVTERRELEAQFHQAQKLEAVGRLAGGIAHDFNNLLTAILGNVQLALEDLHTGHGAAEAITEIQRAGERAKSLVQQILVFNRGLPQDKQVVSMVQLAQEVGRQAAALLPAGVRLDVKVADDTPNVLGHATRLHQVMMNLLTNAGHALEGKAGSIDVSLSRVQVDAPMARHHVGLAEGPALCLSVRDTGRGMDEATRNRIFEPFFTTKEVGKGTGLGLALAYAIVQEHEGVIDVRSTPGEGSTFTVYLPATALSLPPTESKQAAPGRGKGERILYLDDDDALVSLISRSLERLGYRVTAFTDQEEALRHFAAAPQEADVFVTDYNMPGLSGLDVARKVLEIRPGMPVLLISGYVTEALVHTAKQVGVRQVLEKPDGVAALTQGVDAALKA